MSGLEWSDIGAKSIHLALKNVEAAVSDGNEVRKGLRQIEQLARQQPRAQRFQPLRMLIEHADHILDCRDLRRLH